MSIYTGVCKFCGQLVNLDGPANTDDEASVQAASLCDCYKAKTERNVLKQINDAKKRVDELFGDESTKLKFVPVNESETIDFLHRTVELTARRHLLSTSIQLRDYGKAKISLTTKGRIKVERSEVHAYQLEE